MRVTPHFSAEEFACKDEARTPYPPEWIRSRLTPLCSVLEQLRAALDDRRITIVSGYRTPAHNRRVGGARRSQHVEGRAADIRVEGVHPVLVHAMAWRLYRQRPGIGLGGLGEYPTFTHLDTRLGDRLARWRGSRAAANIT